MLELLEERKLSEGHARAVLAVPDHEERRRLARQIVGDGLSVRAAEAAARRAGARQRSQRRSRLDPALLDRARVLLELATGVPVRAKGSSLTVTALDETALAEIVESLERTVGGSRHAD